MTTRVERGPLGRALRWLAPLGVAVVIGVVFGWLSWWFWVIALFPVALGLGLGWTSVFVSALLGGRRPALVWTVALVFCGFAVQQVFEDHHQRRAFADALFETRGAASGMEPAKIEALREVSGTEFLARDAEALLDAQLVARLGLGGAAGRFASRLEAGVRLGGPWRGGRGLELGLVGGLVWLFAELALAVSLARRIERGGLEAGGPDA